MTSPTFDRLALILERHEEKRGKLGEGGEKGRLASLAVSGELPVLRAACIPKHFVCDPRICMHYRLLLMRVCEYGSLCVRRKTQPVCVCQACLVIKRYSESSLIPRHPLYSGPPVVSVTSHHATRSRLLNSWRRDTGAQVCLSELCVGAR